LFMAVAGLKNAVFWDVMPCGSCKNWHSSDTSVRIRATWHNIPENSVLHSHRHENLKAYMCSVIVYGIYPIQIILKWYVEVLLLSEPAVIHLLILVIMLCAKLW
jgi:hypothetical protein